MGGAAMVASDRRSAGTQLDDQSIEIKAGNRIHDVLGDKQHINVNSFSRQVLLTGEVHTDADRASAEQAVAKVENIKSVVNELVVQWPSSMSDRSNDVVLAGKVKATLIDAKGVPARAINVVVERSVVYLQGRLTESEAKQAVELVRTISGVQKVVRLIEIISDAEAAGTK
jgi:osmotically-inducible protein OsmY